MARGIPSWVSLAPGPDGNPNGSYEFKGTFNSSIKFSNLPLDVRYSLTMLCWLYYDSQDGPIVTYWTSQNRRVMIKIVNGKFVAHLRKPGHSATYTLRSLSLIPGWIFLGASYNRSSGEAKVWVDGNVVGVKNIEKDFELGTQNNVTMGARKSNGSYFKGRITQMQVYNLTLTQGQIQAIQDQVLRPGKNASHSCCFYCCCCCCCCCWFDFRHCCSTIFFWQLLFVCLCFLFFVFFHEI